MKYCVFKLQTGMITARCDTHPRDAESQVEPGEAIYYGEADPLRHRIVKRGEIFERVECEKEDFGDGSVWDVEKGRRLSVEEQRILADSALKRQIAALEAGQLRAMREDSLRPNERDSDGKLPRERLQEIDDEIALLRGQLNP